MDLEASDAFGTKPGGFLVAGIGFLLVRFTVLDAVSTDTGVGPFLLSHGVVLVLGLGVSLFGIGLAVSTFDRGYVNTVATWCLLGTAGILLITGLSRLDELVAAGSGSLLAFRTSPVVAHALIGGAVGGVLIGVRSAANRRHRNELSRRADQLTVLNRIIRHEMLNAGSVIGGHATLLAEGESPDERDSFEAIHRGVGHIEEGVREIGFLVRAAREDRTHLAAVDVRQSIDAALERARADHPDATFHTEGELPAVDVWATTELASAVEHLLENAVVHGAAETPEATVGVEVTPRTVRIRIEDDGPGLPPAQQDVLQYGHLSEYDDPNAGFGLPIVRMLIERFGGVISVDVAEGSGTAVTLSLRRTNRPRPGEESYGVGPRELAVVTAASLAAGIAMGALLQAWTEAVPVIGGLYGVQRLGVGWIMHLFHSTLFGVAFAVGVSRTPVRRLATSTLRCVLLGVGWGIVLWLFASGFLMPVLLRAGGIPAPIPMLTLPSLLGHAVWGGLLGLLYEAVS